MVLRQDRKSENAALDHGLRNNRAEELIITAIGVSAQATARQAPTTSRIFFGARFK